MKKFILATLPFISLAGCGNDLPSIEQGKQVVEQRIQKTDCINMVDFSKTDGQSSEFEGIKAYRMTYEANIKLKEGCIGFYSDEHKKFWSNPKKEKASEPGISNMKGIGYRLVNAGELVKIKGKIDFSKSEKGWSGHEQVF